MRVPNQVMTYFSRQLPWRRTRKAACSQHDSSHGYIIHNPLVDVGSNAAVDSCKHCAAPGDRVTERTTPDCPGKRSTRFHNGYRGRGGFRCSTGHGRLFVAERTELWDVHHRHTNINTRRLRRFIRVEQHRCRRYPDGAGVTKRDSGGNLQVHWRQLRIGNDSGRHRGHHSPGCTDLSVWSDAARNKRSSQCSVDERSHASVVSGRGRRKHGVPDSKRREWNMYIPVPGVRSVGIRESRNLPGAGSIPRITSIASVLALLTLLVGMVPVPAARAASGARLSIAPPIVSQTVPAGGTISGSINLQLLSAGTARVSISTELMRPGDQSSFAAPDTSRDALQSWIAPEDTSRTVTFGTPLKLVYHVRVPENAPPGAHAFAILVSQTSRVAGTNTDSNSGVAATGAVGAVVVVTVPGALRPALTTRRIQRPRWVWSGRPARFGIRVRNTGNTMITPSVALHTGSFAGVADQRIAARPLPILPDGYRNIEVSWADHPLVGWFHPKIFVSADGIPTSATTYPTVVVLPPPWLIALIVLAIATPIAASLLRRRRSRQDS